MALLTEEEKEIDPYASLGLETSATDKDVKRAYRQKSLLYHPDKVCQSYTVMPARC